MERMKKESQFIWNHPLSEISGYITCIFNNRSRKAPIHHFLSDTIYTEQCSVKQMLEISLIRI